MGCVATAADLVRAELAEGPQKLGAAAARSRRGAGCAAILVQAEHLAAAGRSGVCARRRGRGPARRFPRRGARPEVLVLGWTIAALRRTSRQARLARRRQQEVARACAALSAQLRIGQVPSVALASAAGEHAVLRDARDALELGGDVVRVWRSQARHPGCAGLLELARAWQVSVRTGAPMSASLEQVTAALTAEQDLRAVVAGEFSAPRATGR